MKNLIKNSLMTTFALLTTAAPVLAEAGGREDNSMLLAYVFLGVCGLIIFLQLIPVMTLVYGIIKGVFSKKEEEAKPQPVKYR